MLENKGFKEGKANDGMPVTMTARVQQMVMGVEALGVEQLGMKQLVV